MGERSDVEVARRRERRASLKARYERRSYWVGVESDVNDERLKTVRFEFQSDCVRGHSRPSEVRVVALDARLDFSYAFDEAQ